MSYSDDSQFHMQEVKERSIDDHIYKGSNYKARLMHSDFVLEEHTFETKEVAQDFADHAPRKKTSSGITILADWVVEEEPVYGGVQ